MDFGIIRKHGYEGWAISFTFRVSTKTLVREEKSALKQIDRIYHITSPAKSTYHHKPDGPRVLQVFNYISQSSMYCAQLRMRSATAAACTHEVESKTWTSADSIWDTRIRYMHCFYVARVSFENNEVLEPLLKLFSKLKDPGKQTWRGHTAKSVNIMCYAVDAIVLSVLLVLRGWN